MFWYNYVKESFLYQFLSGHGCRNQLLWSFGEVKESLSVIEIVILQQKEGNFVIILYAFLYILPQVT